RAAWRRALHGDANAKPWPWADTHAIARLVIERTNSDFIILEGANGRALAFAPGHLERTAMPGERGNCVISAHRDTHFAALRNVAIGDVVKVQRADGRWFRYRIAGTRIVDKHDTWVTSEGSGATLTLITCYPFGAVVAGGPQRFVMSARRIGRSAAPARAGSAG
ncbi:MAG TPA: class GN sortase, partial [Thermoanaerobaculia bacterium]|nr:class GN sortase [Thermoanaerobaculia bacterium]